MNLEDLQLGLRARNVLIAPLEHCVLKGEPADRSYESIVYKGTCFIENAQRDVVFKSHRVQINTKTRKNIVQKIYDEIKNDVYHMQRLPTHAHVIHLYGVTFKDLNPLIIIEGWLYDLDDYLESNADMGHPVPWPEKLQFCMDILLGLQDLHNANIVHGDLKADNVVIVKSPVNGLLTAKIADLGSNYAISSVGPDVGSTTVFLAPERMYSFRSKFPELEGWERSPRQDIYGYGLFVWQVAKDGEVPYSEIVEKRVGAVAIEEKRLQDSNLDELMDKLPHDIDQDLVSIIRQATKLNPSERASLNDIETLLELLVNYTKISFEEMASVNAVADWTQINVSGDVEILLEKKAAMKGFKDFSKSAFLESSLPANLSTVSNNIRHWVFIQCQEGAAQPRSGDWQFLVACCYNWGFGVEWSKKSTFGWLSLAAKANSAEAQCMLGEIYKSGKVVEVNTVEAKRLFTLAVNAGNANAMYLLGLYYYNEGGSTNNNKYVIDLWKKAEKAGVKEAAERLDSESSVLKRFSIRKLLKLGR